MGKEDFQVDHSNLHGTRKPEGINSEVYGHAYATLHAINRAKQLPLYPSEKPTSRDRHIENLAENAKEWAKVGVLPVSALEAVGVDTDLSEIVPSAAKIAFSKIQEFFPQDVLRYEIGTVNQDGSIAGYTEDQLSKEERQVEKVLFQKS